VRHDLGTHELDVAASLHFAYADLENLVISANPSSSQVCMFCHVANLVGPTTSLILQSQFFFFRVAAHIKTQGVFVVAFMPVNEVNMYVYKTDIAGFPASPTCNPKPLPPCARKSRLNSGTRR
jgi:hypothetical protein